jgi:RNA polymerase sigma factor (sigma-70 family)
MALHANALDAPEPRLRRLLGIHGRALERIAASYAHTAADREDLLQDFAVALWTALPAFRGDCSEKTFVLRVAHNRALAFLAKRSGPLARARDVDDHQDDVVATTGKNPALVLLRKERGSRLLACARALPLGHRQVVTLLLEGLSHREIAEVLGTTENNVAVRASRARAALRVLLEDETNEESRP